jgi:hypothetical protein
MLTSPARGRTAAIVAGIIAVSASLCLWWAVKLPMFQGPDEDNHYDYALTLYTAGRPIRGTEGDTQNDTHPTVRYLVDRTGARGLRFDPLATVPPGYGTIAYYRALDQGAPRVDRERFARGPIQPVPFIAKLYPLGYYTLAAGAIGLGEAVSGGSPTAAFFAARLLSVALLVITLWCTWLAFDRFAGRRRATLVLAATALFPIYLSIFAGVQPDNLGSALIAALWLAGLRLLDRPADAGRAALCGLLLAALIATKWHFFAALALPLLVSFALRARLLSAGPSRTLRNAALLTAPAALAFALTKPFLAVPAGAPQLCPTDLTGALSGTLAKGPIYAFEHFGLDGFWYSFVNSFTGSNALWSFWLKFGQYGAPLHIINNSVTTFIAIVIAIFVDAVALLAAAAIAINAVRLGRAWRRDARAALRVISGDFVLNSYLTYFVILFAFEAYAASSVVIRGRYWFAFLAPIWYIAFFVAPKALPRRRRRAAAGVIAAALLTFEAAANIAAFPSIERAYYAPHGPDPSQEIFARFQDRRGKWPDTVDFGTAAPGASVVIRGVAFDRSEAAPVEAVRIAVDGRFEEAQRTDGSLLACILTETRLRESGFAATIDTAAMAAGRHTIALAVRTPRSPGWIDSGARGVVTIAPR